MERRRMIREIRDDFIVHMRYYKMPAWQVFLRFPSLKILLSYRIRTAAKRNGIFLINPLMAIFERALWGIEISTDAILGSVIILHSVGIVIGTCVLSSGCILNGSNTIGSRKRPGQLQEDARPIIGENVELGVGSRILGHLTVGDNVHIGANAVVITDIPSDSIAVGIPAKVKKEYV